jgi:tetratricopeptide (TPR) repeat protein
VLVSADQVNAAGPWRVRLTLFDGVEEETAGEALRPDLIEAAEAAASGLVLHLGGRPGSVPETLVEPIDSIRRALQRHDLDGARVALAGLAPAQRDSADAALLEIELALSAGRARRASELLDALALRADLGDDALVLARARILRAEASRRLGRSEADALLDGTIADLESDREGEATAVLVKALLARGRREVAAGRLGQASQDFARAHHLASARGDRAQAAIASGNLALLQMLHGRGTEALEQLRAASEVYRDEGDMGRLSSAFISMASLQSGLLRWQDALASSDAAAGLIGLIEDSDQRQRHWRSRAMIMLGLGRMDEAEALLARAEAERERAEPDAGSEARQRLGEARLALARGRTQAARAAAEEAFGLLFQRFGMAIEPRLLANARDAALDMLVQATLDDAEGGETRATLPALALDALALAESVPALVARGRWKSAQGDAAGAEADLRLALARADGRTPHALALLAAEAAAELFLAQGRTEAAEALLLELLARDAALIERDYGAALLALRIRQAQGDETAWRLALMQARQLAGQRQVPLSLGLPPGAQFGLGALAVDEPAPGGVSSL